MKFAEITSLYLSTQPLSIAGLVTGRARVRL